MTYQERMVSDKDQNAGNTSSAFPTRSTVKKQKASRDTSQLEKTNCYHFLKGYCQYGNKCLRIHDQKLKDMLQKEDSSENEDSDSTEGDEKVENSRDQKIRQIEKDGHLEKKEDDLYVGYVQIKDWCDDEDPSK